MKRKMMLAVFTLFMIAASSRAQEWFQVASGTNKKLNAIDFPSATVGYIGGNDSLLLKTTDGGQNWSPVNYSGITYYPGGEHIVNLKFINENIGFIAVGPYAGSYKTIDGGSTWTALTELTTCFNEGLYFFDENNGFIGGSGCFQGEKMNKMTAGVWSEPTINTPTWNAEHRIADYDFSSANFGLAASRSGYVLRTTDAGANWDTIPTPSSPMNPLTSILIVNNNLAYAGYESINSGFGLYISTDSGLTWQEDMNSATFLYPDFMCLHESGNGTVFSGGNSSSMSSGAIFESPGDGSTWNYSIVDEQINDISSYNDTIVFAVGDSGYIIINQDWGTASLVNLPLNSLPVEVYPNPVENVLNLIIDEDLIADNSRIKVFSISGELVHSEVFSMQINLGKLKSGIYLVDIETINGLTTKRIIKH
jgi:photosystem II stability/assembly factor-like uncharacterized protein